MDINKEKKDILISKLNVYYTIQENLKDNLCLDIEKRTNYINVVMDTLSKEIEKLEECHIKQDYSTTKDEIDQYEFLRLFFMCYMFYTIYKIKDVCD